MIYSTLLAVVVTTIMHNGINISRIPTASDDLWTLKAVCERHNSTEIVNVNELLSEFKKSTKLQVSYNDLLTYFSNLGVQFYPEV
jgi:hypothetical protein